MKGKEVGPRWKKLLLVVLRMNHVAGTILSDRPFRERPRPKNDLGEQMRSFQTKVLNLLRDYSFACVKNQQLVYMCVYHYIYTEWLTFL